MFCVSYVFHVTPTLHQIVYWVIVTSLGYIQRLLNTYCLGRCRISLRWLNSLLKSFYSSMAYKMDELKQKFLALINKQVRFVFSLYLLEENIIQCHHENCNGFSLQKFLQWVSMMRIIIFLKHPNYQLTARQFKKLIALLIRIS